MTSLHHLRHGIEYLQWASAASYRSARECIDFPPLRIYYQERAAALSYAARVLAGIEPAP
jgi:hypothetical protein